MAYNTPENCAPETQKSGSATWSRIILVVNSHLLPFCVCIGMAEQFCSVHLAAVGRPAGSYGEELLGYICTLLVAKAPAGGKRGAGGLEIVPRQHCYG